jgi:hypothetical protein
MPGARIAAQAAWMRSQAALVLAGTSNWEVTHSDPALSKEKTTFELTFMLGGSRWLPEAINSLTMATNGGARE